MEVLLNQSFSFEISVLLENWLSLLQLKNKTTLQKSDSLLKAHSPVVIVLHKNIDAVKSLTQEQEVERR